MLAKTREPVAIINGFISIIEAGIAMAIALGFFDLDGQQVAMIMAFVIAIGNTIKVMLTRPQVTPMSSPRDNDGTPLVPLKN